MMKKYFPDRNAFIVDRYSLKRRLKAKRYYRVIARQLVAV